MNKEIMTKEEIIKAGGVVGLKYQGKEFPRYALLKSGDLYFRLLNGEYKRQSFTYADGSPGYRLNQYFDYQDIYFDESRYAASYVMIENFIGIDSSYYTVKFRDGNKTNLAIDNLEYNLSKTLLATIISINILQNFYHKFRFIEIPFFKSVSSSVRDTSRHNAKKAIQILNNFNIEELKLAITVLSYDKLKKVINASSSETMQLQNALKYYLNIHRMVTDYSCLLQYNLKEFITICEIAKDSDIYNIRKTKQAIAQIKPVTENDEIKLLGVIYNCLKDLDLDEFIKIIKGYDAGIDNISNVILQLITIKVPRSLIYSILRTKIIIRL